MNKAIASAMAEQVERVNGKTRTAHANGAAEPGQYEIKLSQIRTDGGTQSRAELNGETISDYAEAMKDGALFPPVTVFYDGKVYWLGDGFHRVAAATRNECKTIFADVRQGTRRDAVLFSVGANGAHGLRRTNADKRRAAETLLRDEEWQQWTDSEIARRCGVSHNFVREIRAILHPMQDGKRKVTRNGKTYEQDTSNIGKSRRGKGKKRKPAPSPETKSKAQDVANRAFNRKVEELAEALEGVDPRVIGVVDKLAIDDPKKVEILIRLHKSSQREGSNDTFGDIEHTGGFHYGKDMQQWCDFAADSVEDIEAGLVNLSEQHKRNAVDVRKAERETIPDDMPEHDARYTLHVGNFTEALFSTPDRSIDCIITDPPYKGDALPLYEQLAREAARLLKPGGSLLVMCGQYHLPDVLHCMSMHIRYHWMLSYLTPGGQSPQIFPRKVNTFWKPVLWFVQGDYKGEWIGDVAKSAVNDNDKRFHTWGQSESGMAELVEKFTRAGDVILDPFIGGGTTAIVALKLNRQIIGVDKDAACIETTRERIEQWLLTTSGK